MNPEILNKIIRDGFHSEIHVKHFFTELRLVIERTAEKKYNVVKFYCDWMLHIEKDNLKGMYDYFKNLNEVLNRHELLPDRHEFNKTIELFTSFIELKKQLLEILNKYHVNTSLIEDEKIWNNFRHLLRKLILNKPIRFGHLKENSPRRKILLFVISEYAPIMSDLEGAIYWMLFIDTSSFPLTGIIPESIGLKD